MTSPAAAATAVTHAVSIPSLPTVGAQWVAERQLKDWQALDLCHQRVLEALDELRVLCHRLDNHGVDAVSRELAGRIVDFFSKSARQHHADEDRLVFPALLESKDEVLIQHVRRLQQDHGWLEEDWLSLAPPLEAVAQGYSWYDIDMLRAALPVFTDLYLDHIDLEESLIYPAAKRVLAERTGSGSGRLRRAERN